MFPIASNVYVLIKDIERGIHEQEGNVERRLGSLEGLEAAAGQLHGGILEVDLALAVQLKAVARNDGDIDGSLVVVPRAVVGLGRRVLGNGSLFHLGGVLQGVGSSLGALGGVEALRHDGGAARRRSEAGAGVHGGSQAGALVGGEVNGGRALSGARNKGLHVGVHGSDARVLVVNDVEGSLGHGKGRGVSGNAVAVGSKLHVVGHLALEVVEGVGAVHAVASLAGDKGHGPLHGGRRAIAHLRLGSTVIEHVHAVDAALVRAALVLDHGGLAAEALEAALMAAFVGTLASVNAAVAGQGRRVRESLAAAKVLALMGLLASVGADVDSQGAALDEALAAAGNGAGVGALVGVDSVVSLKIRLAVEALKMMLARIARKAQAREGVPCRNCPSRTGKGEKRSRSRQAREAPL